MKTIDLHIHTSYSSDGELSPKEIVELAEKNGLKIIAITDHNSIEGIEEALEYAREKNVIVIPGIEISCREESVSQVHIIGLFLSIKKINMNEVLYKIPSIAEAIKIIKDSGGISILAHPGIYSHKMEEFIRDFIESGGIGLEIEYPYEEIYGFSIEKSELIRCRLKNIAKEKNLLVSGGSDFHGQKRKVSLGQCGISEGEFEKLKERLRKNKN